jgi:predicted amidohydrolase YtcJ
MLIRNAEIDFMRDFTHRVDVRIEHGRIVAIGAQLAPRAREELLDANGAALLPGLHDHHIHLVALAASLESLQCGPPQVTTAEELGAALRKRAAEPFAVDDDWIRGIGYHESVAGDIDRDWLDRHVPDRPVRIQQRTGRLWIVNSRALERLGAGDAESSEMRAGRPTGRFYDADTWLRQRLGGRFPSLRRVGALLAGFGVTGVTDTTPHNDLEQYRRFAVARKSGELPQDLLIMGDASLDAAQDGDGIRHGATKIHLHEISLPPFDDLCATIRRSHTAGRSVAIHCVTLTELVFSAGALGACDAFAGDRIEHAALAPPDTLPLLVDRNITVVTQPDFIRERGDAYLNDVPVADQPWLYRLRGLLDAGIPVGGSTDAPFGEANPWLAMHAAVERRTRGGAVLGAAEALTPEQALALFTSDPATPGGAPRRVEMGAPADLCLLDQPWAEMRRDLSGVRVAVTLKAGHPIWRAPNASMYPND